MLYAGDPYAYDGDGIGCPVVAYMYTAANSQPLILTFSYVVSAILSHAIVVDDSSPILSSDKLAFKPRPFVVFPLVIEPEIPILSKPTHISKVKSKILIFIPAVEDSIGCEVSVFA